MVILTAAAAAWDLGSYRRSRKALNSYVQIVFEDKNGDMMSIAEQLPYDVNANVIEVDDCDYGIWYMDVSERPEVYKGKTVRFKGQVLKNKYFKDKNFVPGRKVMTCCAEDTSFIGYISFYDKISSLENRQWITVTAQIAYEFQMAYKKKRSGSLCAEGRAGRSTGRRTGLLLNKERTIPMIQDILPRHLDNQFRWLTPQKSDIILLFEGSVCLQNGRMKKFIIPITKNSAHRQMRQNTRLFMYCLSRNPVFSGKAQRRSAGWPLSGTAFRCESA